MVVNFMLFKSSIVLQSSQVLPSLEEATPEQKTECQTDGRGRKPPQGLARR